AGGDRAGVHGRWRTWHGSVSGFLHAPACARRFRHSRQRHRDRGARCRGVGPRHRAAAAVACGLGAAGGAELEPHAGERGARRRPRAARRRFQRGASGTKEMNAAAALDVLALTLMLGVIGAALGAALARSLFAMVMFLCAAGALAAAALLARGAADAAL